MGKKIFVSYKYADNAVQNLDYFFDSTVRDYVNKFEETLEFTDHIYKGESDGEDLSVLSDSQIWEKLKDRIYDSSVTIIFISPGMKEKYKSDRDQWIPWEVSFSLKEVSRRDKNGMSVTSHSNAMLAVVLPDRNGSYGYYFEEKHCCEDGCRTNHTEKLFKILKSNMFNYINSNIKRCNNLENIWYGEHSYIEAVEWYKFISNYSSYVKKACERQNNIDQYRITKEV